MGGWNNSELHHRQHQGETGHAVLGSVDGSRKRWRAFRVPVGVLALGLLLAMWGPLPGLGLVLVIGGVFGLASTALIVLLGGLS